MSLNAVPDRAPDSARAAPLFDTYVMVDWSSAAVPSRGKDSIWSAVLGVSTGELDVVNHPTRTGAKEALRSLLRESLVAGNRVLVGIDIPYGYPLGTAAALGLDVPTDGSGRARPGWRAMWHELRRLVLDDLDGRPNHNDRFAVAAALNARIGDRHEPGPFWGCPAHLGRPPMSPKKLHTFPYPTATGPLAEFRHAERALRAQRLRPFSVWQTAYAGGVGGQTLMGIPVLHDLVTDPALAERTHVWPFTTGLVADPTATTRWDAPGVIVHAEIWPGALDQVAVDAIDHPIKDARQVTALCHWAAEHDRAGTLGALFAPDLPSDVAADVVGEEGWVLGVAGGVATDM